MSTRADATLIQSATESHRAEWLREGPASESCCGRVWETPGTSADVFLFHIMGHFVENHCRCCFQTAKDISVGSRVKETMVSGYSNRERLLFSSSSSSSSTCIQLPEMFSVSMIWHPHGDNRGSIWYFCSRVDCDDVTELQSFAVTLFSKLAVVGRHYVFGLSIHPRTS